jgi:hypothetical protein
LSEVINGTSARFDAKPPAGKLHGIFGRLVTLESMARGNSTAACEEICGGSARSGCC